MIKTIYAEEIHNNLEVENEKLKAWLNVLWLRPACALQKALEMKHFSKFLPFEEPAADLGCGDGTHSTLICGARFDSDFDMYLSVNTMNIDKQKSNTDRIHFKLAKEEDEYYKGGDAFLYFERDKYEGKVKFVRKHSNKFYWGCDLQESLIQKASILGTYEKLSVQDLSKRLEASDNYFKTIYSNVSYWMDDKENLFKEQNRIMSDDGAIFMTAQDPIIHKEIALTAVVRNNLKKMNHIQLPKWIKEVDRGRIAQVSGKLLNVQDWTKLFNSTGLELVYHGQFMSRDAYWQYDMDLRETFPSDSWLAQQLNMFGENGAKLRKEWKKRRIEHYFKKWQQFYHDEDNWQKGIPRAWNFFVIKKAGKKSWVEKFIK